MFTSSEYEVYIPHLIFQNVNDDKIIEIRDFFKKLIDCHPTLSKRQREICGLIFLGYDNYKISKEINISTTSLNTYKTRLRKKMGISNSKISLNEFINKI